MVLVSVVIATYNRANFLEKLLGDFNLQAVDSRFGFEVVIVDNNSSDQTKTVVESFIHRFPEKFVYLSEKRQGKSLALNAGIQKARGDILAFTDDDVRLDPCWLKSLVECFLRHGCDGVGGKVVAQFPEDAPAWIKDNVDLLQGAVVFYDYGDEILHFDKPMFEFIGANQAFRREVFLDCGLYRTDIGPGHMTNGEDTEFVQRVLQRKKKLLYCGKAKVFHPVERSRMTLRYIARWYILLGRYRAIEQLPNHQSGMVYCLDVPRYLIGKIIKEAGLAMFNIFRSREFINRWIALSLDIGLAQGVRKSRSHFRIQDL